MVDRQETWDRLSAWSSILPAAPAGNNRTRPGLFPDPGMIPLVQLLLGALALHLALGVLFAIPFVCGGAGRVVPEARGATWGFRLCLLPGAVALWPVLAWRWWRGGPHPEHNAHRDAADPAGGGA